MFDAWKQLRQRNQGNRVGSADRGRLERILELLFPNGRVAAHSLKDYREGLEAIIPPIESLLRSSPAESREEAKLQEIRVEVLLQLKQLSFARNKAEGSKRKRP